MKECKINYEPKPENLLQSAGVTLVKQNLTNKIYLTYLTS